MGKYVFKRLGQSLIVVFIVTVIVFGLMHLLPGDPIQIYLGDTATEEQIAYYTKQFGLDQPLPVQYIRWIGGLFKGEMGRSITYSIDVKELLLKELSLPYPLRFLRLYWRCLLVSAWGLSLRHTEERHWIHCLLRLPMWGLPHRLSGSA